MKIAIFEPTGANGTVGSYTSLSVCLSVCLSLLQNSNWTKIHISGYMIDRFTKPQLLLHGIRSNLAIEPGACVGGLTSTSSCIFFLPYCVLWNVIFGQK